VRRKGEMIRGEKRKMRRRMRRIVMRARASKAPRREEAGTCVRAVVKQNYPQRGSPNYPKEQSAYRCIGEDGKKQGGRNY
jgi:hypothetical protein